MESDTVNTYSLVTIKQEPLEDGPASGESTTAGNCKVIVKQETNDNELGQKDKIEIHVSAPHIVDKLGEVVVKTETKQDDTGQEQTDTAVVCGRGSESGGDEMLNDKLQNIQSHLQSMNPELSEVQLNGQLGSCLTAEEKYLGHDYARTGHESATVSEANAERPIKEEENDEFTVVAEWKVDTETSGTSDNEKAVRVETHEGVQTGCEKTQGTSLDSGARIQSPETDNVSPPVAETRQMLRETLRSGRKIRQPQRYREYHVGVKEVNQELGSFIKIGATGSCDTPNFTVKGGKLNNSNKQLKPNNSSKGALKSEAREQLAVAFKRKSQEEDNVVPVKMFKNLQNVARSGTDAASAEKYTTIAPSDVIYNENPAQKGTNDSVKDSNTFVPIARTNVPHTQAIMDPVSTSAVNEDLMRRIPVLYKLDWPSKERSTQKISRNPMYSSIPVNNQILHAGGNAYSLIGKTSFSVAAQVFRNSSNTKDDNSMTTSPTNTGNPSDSAAHGITSADIPTANSHRNLGPKLVAVNEMNQKTVSEIDNVDQRYMLTPCSSKASELGEINPENQTISATDENVVEQSPYRRQSRLEPLSVFPEYSKSKLNAKEKEQIGNKVTSSVTTVRTVACLYCQMLVEISRIMEHFVLLHTAETEVKKALIKDGFERQAIVLKLFRWGNFKHNITVRKSGQGKLIIGRTCVQESLEKFLPCVFCLRFYHENMLPNHCRSCPLKHVPDEDKKDIHRNYIRGAKSLLADLIGNKPKHFVPCYNCLSFYPVSERCTCKQGCENAKGTDSEKVSDSSIEIQHSKQFTITKDGLKLVSVLDVDLKKTNRTRKHTGNNGNRQVRTPDVVGRAPDMLSITSPTSLDSSVTNLVEGPNSSMINYAKGHNKPKGPDLTTESGAKALAPRSFIQVKIPGVVGNMPVTLNFLKSSTAKRTEERVTVKCQNNPVHACLYCGILLYGRDVLKHLVTDHADQPEVRDALARDTCIGPIKLEKIQIRGNYKHNMQVLKCGRGELILATKPIGFPSAKDCLPCAYCLGFYNKSDFVSGKHLQQCKYYLASKHSERTEHQIIEVLADNFRFAQTVDPTKYLSPAVIEKFSPKASQRAESDKAELANAATGVGVQTDNIETEEEAIPFSVTTASSFEQDSVKYSTETEEKFDLSDVLPSTQETLRSGRKIRRPHRFGEYVIEEKANEKLELDMDCYDDDDYDDVDETYKPDTQQQEESDNFDSSDSSVEASENDTELQKPRKQTSFDDHAKCESVASSSGSINSVSEKTDSYSENLEPEIAPAIHGHYKTFTQKQKFDVKEFAKIHGIRAAAKHFNVPKSTVWNWNKTDFSDNPRNCKTGHLPRPGRPLTYDENPDCGIAASAGGGTNSVSENVDSDCENLESEIAITPPQSQETLRSRRKIKRPQRFGEYVIGEKVDVEKSELDMDCYDDDDVDETYKLDTQQQEESEDPDNLHSSAEASENETELQTPTKSKQQNQQQTAKRKPKSTICCFCGEMRQGRIMRHILRLHKKHIRVRLVLKFQKGSPERKLAVSLLLKEVYFSHNKKVLETGVGQLTVNEKQSYIPLSHFFACERCKELIPIYPRYKFIHDFKCKSHEEELERLMSCAAKVKPETDKLNNRINNKRRKEKLKSTICCFCGEMKQGRIMPHILRLHKKHSRVRLVLKFQKGSPERKLALSLLLKEVYFSHNKKVLESRVGQLTINEKRSHIPLSHFFACERCKELIPIYPKYKHTHDFKCKSHEEVLERLMSHSAKGKRKTNKALAGFCGCAARFESYLVTNTEDRFSCDEAHILQDPNPKHKRTEEEDNHFFTIFAKNIRDRTMPERELLDRAISVIKNRTILQPRARVNNLIKNKQIQTQHQNQTENDTVPQQN